MILMPSTGKSIDCSNHVLDYLIEGIDFVDLNCYYGPSDPCSDRFQCNGLFGLVVALTETVKRRKCFSN